MSTVKTGKTQLSFSGQLYMYMKIGALPPNGVSGSHVPFLLSYCKNDSSFLVYWHPSALERPSPGALATLGRSVARVVLVRRHLFRICL